MEQPYLFISHSSKDRQLAEDLANHLGQAGYRCWIDVSDIPDGSSWPREIEKAVERCGALIVIMTERARASEWVERETLLALQLRKPVFIARFDDVPLPIYLIDRQASDFRVRPEAALKKLIKALRAVSLTKPEPPASSDAEKRRVPTPNEHNFFKYVEQLPNGVENARIARAWFAWAETQADTITFSGRSNPAFRAHVWVGPGGVLVCSLRAYPKQPAIELPLQYLTEFPPYDDRAARLRVLHACNALLPAELHFSDDRADRRPNIPLLPPLADEANLAALQSLVGEIMANLRKSN
jgi:hypothetical protein